MSQLIYFMNKHSKTFALVFVLSISCATADIVDPQQNIVFAQMTLNSSPLLIEVWEKEIEQGAKSGTLSEEEREALETKIKNEKQYMRDMQSVIKGDIPSGEGIEIREQSAQQQIRNSEVGSPVYCNLKNLLRIYDRLKRGEPIGSYSCEDQ